MKSIQIKDSYNIWSTKCQKIHANKESYLKYAEKNASHLLHRSWTSIHIEWWLHNIGYYVTKPFNSLQKYNLRFKDVDLEERYYEN